MDNVSFGITGARFMIIGHLIAGFSLLTLTISMVNFTGLSIHATKILTGDGQKNTSGNWNKTQCGRTERNT